MRILILSWKDNNHPLAGGSEVLIDRLAHGLHERGHDVTVLCGGPVGAHDYTVVDAGPPYRQYVTDPFVVRRRFRDVDVIVDVCNGMAFYSPLWSRKPIVAIVNHIHFGMWQEWFSPIVAWLGSTMETRVMPLVYRNNLIVGVSQSTADTLESLGVRRNNIRVVHNGVDLPDDVVDQQRERVFIAVGRLVPHKQFDVMLRAWERVRTETGGKLLIAGEGPERSKLEALAPPDTEFLGRITEEEKIELMSRAWLLVQPSRLEGWGIVVMEAAACGTPTIGFRAPGTRDAVIHDETGLLASSENDLVRNWIELASDGERREVLAKAARRRAEQFSWDRTVHDFEHVLFETVARRA
jgi:glycosyltransferase involved in cell wall biosynthesis